MVKRQFEKGVEGKMKKTICSILAAIMCLSLCACGGENIQSAEAAIAAIGTISEDSEAAIIAAEELYNGLTEKQKEKVSNTQVLIEARDEFDRQMRVAAFVKYLKATSDKNSATGQDYNLSISVDEKNVILIQFDNHELIEGFGDMNTTCYVSIPTEKGDATFIAEGKTEVLFFSSAQDFVKHQAKGLWNIVDYNKGKNAIDWDLNNTFDIVNITLSGDTYENHSESFFVTDSEKVTSSYLDIITTYLASILEKSETGATMADIGFLSY